MHRNRAGSAGLLLFRVTIDSKDQWGDAGLAHAGRSVSLWSTPEGIFSCDEPSKVTFGFRFPFWAYKNEVIGSKT